MATLALPITNLLPAVDRAKSETRSVVVRSLSNRADAMTLFYIAGKTLGLSYKFARLAHRQQDLISSLVERDFSATPTGEIKAVAEAIDELVSDERDTLKQAYKLGSEIRAWWNPSLVKLAGQMEHLDSIAESLHLECDSQSSALCAMAVQHVAEK